MKSLDCFDEIWLCDTEYMASPGCRVQPICLVAREARSGREIRLWGDDLTQSGEAPFRIDDRSLFVAYAVAAEFGVFHVLGWPPPRRVLDLFAEFRACTNGLLVPHGNGLLGAMLHHGLPAMDGAEKKTMRDLAIRGGPFTDDERQNLLDYCAEDVRSLERLLPAMLPGIDLPRALLRGRYGWAVASMEHRGIPIDMETLHYLRDRWGSIREFLVRDVDERYHVFEGTTFKRAKFERWLADHKIPWPCLPSGELDLQDETFRAMARARPEVAELRELRAALGSMRLFADLAVGPDGRNRTSLMPFRARTSRNQPSNARFIFGPSRFLRSLIKPAGGMALAYLDYQQQEFGIAAALSGDPAMGAAYLTGDPYLAFGKQAGLIPEDGTKQTHAAERALCKACVLAVQYGMGEVGLASRIGKPDVEGRRLIRLHQQTYPMFWAWSQSAVDRATLTMSLESVFGWPIHVGRLAEMGRPANPRSLANFPCQANGAEMLRLACCMLVEAGIGVCAPVHDAVLIEAPTSTIDNTVHEAQQIMIEASKLVLSGFAIGTDSKVVRWPDRYVDESGSAFWHTIMRVAERVSPAVSEVAV